MQDEIKKYTQAGKKNIILVYALYLLGVVFMMYLFPIIGACICLYNFNNPNHVWQTHYEFALRSFAIGALALIIIWVVGITCISVFNTGIIFGPIMIAVSSVLVSVWFIVRGIIALQFLLDEKAHPNPKTVWIK